ncbi:MAG: hypothetical protein HQ521_07845 [Bacteroidetes bacterium]|nr:hypothetical protein [Bacteroidota bacterium]
MKAFVRIIDIIVFKVLPALLISGNIILIYGGRTNHFPLYIWLRGDAFYQFIIELMMVNSFIVLAIILAGIGKGIHSHELKNRFIYFWPLYFFICVWLLSDFAGGINNYNSLLFYISFTVSQLLYILFYKIFKSEMKNIILYVKKLTRPIFEINTGIFRLLIVTFSILSLIFSNNSIGGMAWEIEAFIWGILFAIIFFILLWFFVWLLLILNVVDWVIKGFKEEK